MHQRLTRPVDREVKGPGTLKTKNMDEHSLFFRLLLDVDVNIQCN